MPNIIPFRGVLYDPTKVNIDDVVAPPYDVISKAQQEKLYERHPYNVVRLILGKEEDPYSSAAEYSNEWMRLGILARDVQPALYVLCQTFRDVNGRNVSRKGFIALCQLEEFEKKIVLPHEKTLSKPREDRLRLFKATNSNFSQVFSLYSDSKNHIDRVVNGLSKSQPAVDVVFENVHNNLWRLHDPVAIRQIRDDMQPKQVLIADGHHRYETALTYRDLMRSQNPSHDGTEPYNYVMMFFTNVNDEGLVIYPTHRIVHSLEMFDAKACLEKLREHFIVREFKEREALLMALSASSVRSFGVLLAGESSFFLMTLKPTSSAMELVKEDVAPEVKELDVTLLHSVVLRDILGISVEAQEQKRNIEYVRDAADAFSAVETKQAQLAFLMNPTKIEQVRAIATGGFTMPQKSTYFYPKLLSGLVLNMMTQ
ncbi:MAG TPA: DUF1015 domain-containing protein [Bacteroidetes bacterium]|nr:DUF1015 domain-containing protein [Bacteroidota bacterium]